MSFVSQIQRTQVNISDSFHYSIHLLCWLTAVCLHPVISFNIYVCCESHATHTYWIIRVLITLICIPICLDPAHNHKNKVNHIDVKWYNISFFLLICSKTFIASSLAWPIGLLSWRNFPCSDSVWHNSTLCGVIAPTPCNSGLKAFMVFHGR